MQFLTLNYRDLIENGCTRLQTRGPRLIFSLRGRCMVDVFDLEVCRHIGYLDFDMQRDILLAHAFGSPVIGLPFTRQMRHTFGRLVSPFKDIRAGHDVGFFIEPAYRNKGEKGIWNLDETMMAVALETAGEHGVKEFTIKPTNDRTRYYRKKFGALVLAKPGSDLTLVVDTNVYRRHLRHIRFSRGGGKTILFEINGEADPRDAAL